MCTPMLVNFETEVLNKSILRNWGLRQIDFEIDVLDKS